MYTTAGKPTGLKLKTESRLIWFMAQTGFGSKPILSVVEEYLETSGDFTSSLQNLIWKPSSIYAVHKSLNDSKLYDLMCKKHKLNDEFFLKKNKGKKVEYLSALARLQVPTGSSVYLTGSKKGDEELLLKFKKEYLKLAR